MSKQVFLVSSKFGSPDKITAMIRHRQVFAKYAKRELVGMVLNPSDLSAYNKSVFTNAGKVVLGGVPGPSSIVLDPLGVVEITSNEAVSQGYGIYLEVPSHFEEQVQEFKARRPLAAPPSPEGEPRSRAWAWSSCSCPSSGCCVHIQPEGKSWADIWPGVWKDIMKKLGLK